MSLRILLIEPACHPDRRDPGPTRLPFELAQAAGAMRRAGGTVDVLSRQPRSELVKVLESRIGDAPDLVGFHVQARNRDRCYELAEWVRRRWPEARIALWGPYADVYPQELLEDGRVDLIIRREVERPMELLVERLQAGGEPRDVPGVDGRSGEERFSGGPAEIIHQLDDLPLPARDLFAPIQEPPFWGQVQTYRGCPYRCAYCLMADGAGRTVRRHSPERVIQEIRLELDRGARAIEFVDETFTLDREAVRTLCRDLSRELPDLEWHCYTRTTHVDPELLGEMVSAGCRSVFFGVGTGVQRLGKVLETPVDLESARTALRHARVAGLRTTAAFSLGLPRESWIDSWRTIRFALGLGSHRVILQPCLPVPGTRLHATALQEGRMLVEDLSLAQPGREPVYLPTGRRLGELRLTLLAARVLAGISSRLRNRGAQA